SSRFRFPMKLKLTAISRIPFSWQNAVLCLLIAALLCLVQGIDSNRKMIGELQSILGEKASRMASGAASWIDVRTHQKALHAFQSGEKDWTSSPELLNVANILDRVKRSQGLKTEISSLLLVAHSHSVSAVSAASSLGKGLTGLELRLPQSI